MMIAQSCAESTWEIINYGRFINQFPPNIIRSIRQFETSNKYINTIYKSTYIYIYMYILLHEQDVTQGRFKQSLADLKSDFSLF